MWHRKLFICIPIMLTKENITTLINSQVTLAIVLAILLTISFDQFTNKQYKYQPFDAPLSTHDDNKVWRRVKLWLAGRRVNLGLAEELEIAYISN